MPELTTILFYIFALITVGFAIIVVSTKNVMYSAISLFMSLFGIAALFLLLRADFLALTQIMVYIGGILVLLIFGIMLTTKITDAEIRTSNLSYIPAAFFTTGIFVILIFVLYFTKWKQKTPIQNEETISQIGKAFLSTHVLPFEIASIVLLVALIGAIMFSRKNKS